MSYKIVATKEDQTMRSVRQSLLIAAAKARVWASEGWEVVVTDGEGKALDPAGFDKLFELKQVTALTFVASEPEPLLVPEPAEPFRIRRDRSFERKPRPSGGQWCRW